VWGPGNQGFDEWECFRKALLFAELLERFDLGHMGSNVRRKGRLAACRKTSP